MKATTTALGYVRVSTDEQAASGLGLADQRARIEAYAAMRGLRLSDIIADSGVSGGKPIADRPGGGELLRRLHSREASSVIILKLDRGFRNAADCLATVETWERRGTTLHIIDLGGNSIDTASAAGKFMLTVLAGAAEMERNLTRERTRAALAQKRRCNQLAGNIPYGWRLADSTKDADGGYIDDRLVPVEAEQAVIRRILAMRGERVSYARIAGVLDADGVHTKRGCHRWSWRSVHSIAVRNGRTHLK